MGTVSTSTLLGSLVDLDALNNEVSGIETLGVGIGLSVLKEGEDVLSRLHGPASLGDAELLACIDEKHKLVLMSQIRAMNPVIPVPDIPPSSSKSCISC